VRPWIPGGKIRKRHSARRSNIWMVSRNDHAWGFYDMDNRGHIRILFWHPDLDWDVETLGLEEDGDCAVEGEDVDLTTGKNSGEGVERGLGRQESNGVVAHTALVSVAPQRIQTLVYIKHSV